MRTITNATATKLYDLNGVNQVVVQKGNVGSKYIYALQLLHNQIDTVVYRARPGQNFVKLSGSNPSATDVARVGCLYLKGITNSNGKQAAGGHTQTWEYAGTSNENNNGGWFIGTKPKVTDGIKWDTQIARVPFHAAYYTRNTELPRISNLNAAGRNWDINYSGDNLVRAEAAVAPGMSGKEYQWLLIATVDKAGTGYFSLYDLAEMNAAINTAGTSDVNLAKDAIGGRAKKAFKIPGFVDKVGSIQGYDIDKNLNIYVSSQYAPKGSATARSIVKIPWGSIDSDSWTKIDLRDNNSLDINGFYTEFEGIQVISENSLYLTVAYHDANSGTTKKNRIYRVNW
ncbi:bacteriocin [Lactobacillus sp. PV037]|uniref:helveticin J family class III bacteriocin n=1 Tax=unclassified Lactobacillus TaxID=2620435 RepID=UPI00223F3731|nr:MULTISPECIES: helveticin J family class III bacteriocin [unclassified Lactobacillus]QNQ81646.1 bacteriocin [Lactobacillus sp. PV012]QNQ84307.1 bacteriocin [Lactobacillus sp. PV037]